MIMQDRFMRKGGEMRKGKLLWGITALLLLSTAHATISSESGLYHASVTYGGGVEFFVKSFALSNQNGEIMYIKENPDAHAFYISDSGVVFALSKNRLYLYGQYGDEILLKELNCPNGFGFSPDNFLFFASDKDGIFAYSNKGDPIYKFNQGRLFASTIEGKMVAIISTDTLFVYENGAQKFTRKLSTPYTRSLSLSDDKKSIIIEIPSGIEIFDFQTGERLGAK